MIWLELGKMRENDWFSCWKVPPHSIIVLDAIHSEIPAQVAMNNHEKLF